MKSAKKRERLDKKHKGGSRTLSQRTKRLLRETKKTVLPPLEITRDELSGKIQWLIDFAGSEDVMKHIMSKLTTFKKKNPDKLERIMIMGKMDENAGYKNKIIFNTYGNGVGHWIYFSRTGEEFNSYKLGHQKPLTNQFCQSFAIMYLLMDWALPDMPDFVSRFHSSLTAKTIAKKNEIWGHNIEIIIDMWKWIFNKNSSKTWIIKEMKLINNEYIAFNTKTKAKSKHNVLIADNTDDIDFKMIENKLDDIVVHKMEIARET